jgi:hypothetical protein
VQQPECAEDVQHVRDEQREERGREQFGRIVLGVPSEVVRGMSWLRAVGTSRWPELVDVMDVMDMGRADV